MSDRLLLHVGTPKTGTTYLQDVLFRNRELLATHGISYPATRFDSHFLAALDLMKLPWGGLQGEAIGAWDEVSAAVREATGTAIVSHEILATASRSQIGRALESLGHGSGTEVHLVLSVRDFVRQIPAEWQENVKHRATLSYRAFLDQIRDPERESRIGSWFWGVQEIPDILNRWGEELPPEHVHLVTVPPPGVGPELLWKRFSQAFGLDGIDLDLVADRVNPSLGVPETALIRRINRRSNAELQPAAYRPLVRELLAHQTLSRRGGSKRLALPPDLHAWAQGISEAWVEEIERRGYDVVGELSDLVGGPPTEEYADPDRPPERQVASAAVDAIKALLLDNARVRREDERLRADLEETQRALEEAQIGRGHRLRTKVVRGLDSSAPGRAALKAYRATRGRSSRSA